MTITAQNVGAQEEPTVKSLYEDVKVAEEYINQRFGHAWGKLLHCKQAMAVDRLIDEIGVENVFEIAPGPARLATELKGVRHGLMLDNSAAMLAVAQRRLQSAGLAGIWELHKGNAFQLENLGEKFTFIFTFRFIRHFRKEERVRLYASISECLNPRGLLMFDVVNKTVRREIESRNSNRPDGELNVFDETYSAESFKEEMNKNGFHVLRLQPVVNHFFVQSWVANRLGYRFPRLAYALVCVLEIIPSKAPLEWIALCEKSAEVGDGE